MRVRLGSTRAQARPGTPGKSSQVETLLKRPLPLAIRREHKEPEVRRQPVSLGLLTFYGLVLFAASFYLGRYSGHFSGTSLDPSLADSELTTEAANSAQAFEATPSSAESQSGLRILHVRIRNMKFSPDKLEIRKGDVVEWANEDLTPHTATSVSFDSGSIEPDHSWRKTFTEAGEFPYACTFHPDMKATVTVDR